MRSCVHAGLGVCLLVVQQLGYPSQGPPRTSVDGEHRSRDALHIGFWRVFARVQLYAYRDAWLAVAARLAQATPVVS